VTGTEFVKIIRTTERTRSCPIVLKDANDKETEAKVRAIFSKWAKQENSPIKQIAARTELRKLEAVPQAAMMLEASPCYSFDDTLTREEVRDSGEMYKGTYGYLPINRRVRLCESPQQFCPRSLSPTKSRWLSLCKRWSVCLVKVATI